MKIIKYYLCILLILLPVFSSASLVAENDQCEFDCCYINTIQKKASQGETITVIFGVFCNEYEPCGDPVELKPRPGQTKPTGDFIVKGSPTIYFTDIVVTPTGKPGEYTAELNLPLDAFIGKATVFIVQNSLYNGVYYGPDIDTSYLETPDPIDDSTLTIEIFAITTTTAVSIFDQIPGGIATLIALIALIAILILLILYAIYRHARARSVRRRKKR